MNAGENQWALGNKSFKYLFDLIGPVDFLSLSSLKMSAVLTLWLMCGHITARRVKWIKSRRYMVEWCFNSSVYTGLAKRIGEYPTRRGWNVNSNAPYWRNFDDW